MAFDTYKAVRELEDVGFDENAARTVVSMVSSAFTDKIATKSDIADMATKADIAELRSEIRELDARMTVRFVWVTLGIVVITTSLTSGIVGLLNQLQG